MTASIIPLRATETGDKSPTIADMLRTIADVIDKGAWGDVEEAVLVARGAQVRIVPLADDHKTYMLLTCAKLTVERDLFGPG